MLRLGRGGTYVVKPGWYRRRRPYTLGVLSPVSPSVLSPPDPRPSDYTPGVSERHRGRSFRGQEGVVYLRLSSRPVQR